MANNIDFEGDLNSLWGPIDLVVWRETPHKKDSVATEHDVEDGLAVFYINPEGKEHSVLDIKIPCLAYQIDEATNQRNIVIVIQGERIGEEEIVGVRYLSGGNGICALSELQILPDTIDD